MRKTRKRLTRALGVMCAGTMLLGVVTANYESVGSTQKLASASAETIQSVDGGLIDTHTEDYFDSSKVYKLTDTVKADTDISVILSLDEDTLLDAYDSAGTDISFSQYTSSPAAYKAQRSVIKAESKLVKKLNRSGVKYTIGETYDTLLNGFEVTIKTGDYSKLAEAVPEAKLIVGEEYEKCETEVVTNDVDVYETGIFDSSKSDYNGDGVAVAVLDTGLDYTHSAFSVENFEYENLLWGKSDLDSIIPSLHAATTTADLTSNDVYINEKVPYQYDYADKDADVFPINSEHGTHVSGVITGNDDEITGVAPSAQLMMMKVFSDSSSGAKTSWILAALEDCVKLGVDVINMSLGTSCGFSRESDNDEVNAIYDQIEEHGISLVCAASNDYNSTYGSDKNGSLGLTSNPDSATVGAPSTYESAMSVGSVSGVATNYILYGDTVIYFNEASDSTATTRSFFDDIIRRYEEQYGVTVSEGQTLEIPYEVIPGLGRNSDYSRDDYTGEIVLVKRGTTTFEEKIRIAMNHNALGIIIYNNVSGSISMSIGSNETAAACSISQDDGELLVAAGSGTLRIGSTQQAGPFMSDFSSWGPTPDLKIKPEITAHGGEIYSCVPGQSYERLSGTSMAAPNMSGVTALIRQYVKEHATDKFKISEDSYTNEVTSIVNKLEMSTADILYNKNGLPYSVRKQGSGLVNLYSAQKTDAYISTLDAKGNETDKAKIELGDDVDRVGVYTMSFIIKNISSSAVEYKIDSLMQTEGVSTTYTSHGDTTVTQDGEALSGTKTEVVSVSGGTKDGNTVRVAANGEATVEVEITLSEDDKEYMDKSFENGMYVEGFITLEQLEGSSEGDFVDLSVPVLGFYGDWTEAPIFDEEYYDTNADELNAGLDEGDKIMADTYATRVVGGLYDDYIVYMGCYYFNQDPSAVQIAASKDHIAMSNQTNTSYYNVNNLAYVYAGLLRSAGEIVITITEDATGKTIYTDTVYDQRKSYGTSSISPSAIDLGGFSAYDYNLKNNTQYTVTLDAYVDYTEHEQNNRRSTFSFPLYIDYESPVLTGVEFRKEYDSTTKKTSLYADLSIYDNHYAMAAQVGNVTRYEGTGNYMFSLNTFGNYFTPIASSFNSTSVVSIEMTDYINDLKDSAGYDIREDGTYSVTDHTNSFIVVIYDYAMNSSCYEVRLPDEIISMYFGGENVVDDGDETTVTLALNETLDLTTILNIYPSTSWVQTFNYKSSDESKVRIVNQTILALDYTEDGKPVVITVTANTQDGGTTKAYLNIIVEGNEGYTLPVVNSFSLESYYVNKAFYSMSSDEREIGLTGSTYGFGDSPSLSMFPSESVTVNYNLQTYFPEETYVLYSVGNSNIATVSDDGTIVAQAEGSTTVTATVYYQDPSNPDKAATSQRSARISITVKDPFTTSSIYLMSYKGLGGEVEIPGDRGITTIYEYAFSNYEYVPKDLDNGDEISDEDPYNTKPTFIGEDTITKVIIPEGVKEIDGYAFANLTALEEVVFPSTLTRIGYGAFYGCTSLTTISFSSENNIQFINESAFYMCESLESFDFSSVVAIGKYAFAGCDLSTVRLERSCQSIGSNAFQNNKNLRFVDIYAPSIKIDTYAFAGCSSLRTIEINASVIPSYAFYNCTALESVTLGPDVEVINAFAFDGTSVTKFQLNSNTHLELDQNGTMVYSDEGKVLQIVAPGVTGDVALKDDTTTISNGAFAGSGVETVTGQKVVYVKDYAFRNCRSLTSVTFGNLEEIGEYAFYNTKIESLPDMTSGTSIGTMAFAYTSIVTLKIEDKNLVIGDYAFYNCDSLICVSIADGCQIGQYAFFDCGSLKKVAIGEECVIGDYAFAASIYPDFYTWYTVYYDSDTMSVGSYWTSYGDGYTGYFYSVTNPDYDPDDPESSQTVDAGQLLGDTYFYADGFVEYFFRYDIAKSATGVLTKVTIGSGTAIGTGAFENCAHITDLVLGTTKTEREADVVIGDYAFYNCVSLTATRGMFDNVVSIGAYAFSVMDETIDVMYPVYKGTTAYLGNLEYAYDIDVIGGVVTLMGYRYTQHSGALSEEIDLSSVKEIGEGAFAYNKNLTSVILNDELSSVSAYAFYECSSLTLICKETYYDENSGICYLTDMESIGEYALAYTGISSVVLSDEMLIYDGAFYGCENLCEAENLDLARFIGAYAFAYTSLGLGMKTLDVSGAEYIGDYAFAYIVTGDSATERDSSEGDAALYVDFLGKNAQGDGKLKDIGENPFLGTDVVFYVTVTEEFNGEEIVSENVNTYTINNILFVSDGVLYTVVGTEDWTGYVLVTYPVRKDDAVYTLEDGTVRISAHAVDGNEYLSIVTLSSELASIGDKAFYGCENLSVVVFTSYYAPALEEEYDESYYGTITGYPASYYMPGYDIDRYDSGTYYVGLGIVDYFEWSVTPNNYFYGANFVDYIGRIENKLTMVVPVNGQQYDSFTLAQYFDTVIYGATAATSDTLTVIAMIEELPESRYITLADSEDVYAALAAYNALSPDQQALVSNYSKLTACIGTLSWLEYDGSSETGDAGVEKEKSSSSFMKDNMWGLIIALVILVAFVALLVYTILMKKRQTVAAEVQGVEEGSDEAPTDGGVVADLTSDGAEGGDTDGGGTPADEPSDGPADDESGIGDDEKSE